MEQAYSNIAGKFPLALQGGATIKHPNLET